MYELKNYQNADELLEFFIKIRDENRKILKIEKADDFNEVN